MNAVKSIREMLGETQMELAAALRVSQTSVSFYESGQGGVRPEVAMSLMAHARDHGYVLTLDHIYGLKPLPKRPNLASAK